ncbi:restriction endonuclease subunit S (plasmid) [Pediococcus acidilactici]|uniref:restriction endonuclease subunit S n=1 Tax=Pediococcus acidilactici TaxID=1254 RepID=UPI00330621B7
MIFKLRNRTDFFDKDISNEKNLNTYYVVRDGDFVYNPRISNFAPVGPIKRNTLGRTGVMSPLYYIFRAHNVDGKYLEKYFSSTKWHRFMELNGDTGARADRFAIKDKDFVQMPIPLPNLEEQSKIARFLENVDNLIAANQRKLDLLKEQKKGYLQKMFPKNGTKVPELRFAGFADAWEQRKLGELGKIYTGNTPKTSDLDNWTDNKEGHIWITPTDIDKLIMSDSDRHLSEQGWSKARKIPENSVLITSIASIGKNAINAVPVAFNQQINAIVPEKNDSYFILSAMIKDTARFASVAGQTATAIINKTTFEKFQIATPSYEEQQKIGSFFKQLDNTITIHQRKLEKLQELKKGYLQKMFV